MKKYKFFTRENPRWLVKKTSKYICDNLSLGVKFLEKLSVKNTTQPSKKTEKREKFAFTGSYGFHGKKKKTVGV